MEKEALSLMEDEALFFSGGRRHSL